MSLAAGLGTRLGEITARVPKALVQVGEATLLERVARRLVAAGADRLIVNVHHHAPQVEQFLIEHDLGAPVFVSHEPDAPFDTGGGLLHARSLFRGDGTFLVHNVDILSDLPLERLVDAHEAEDALITLAVMERETSRVLLFDEEGLVGHANFATGNRTIARAPLGPLEELAFCGVHAASSRLFDLVTERGRFSIFDPYLRLAAAGERVLPFRVDGSRWIDVGRPDTLERARREWV